MQECVGRERQRGLQEKTGVQGRGQQIESRRRQRHPKDLGGGGMLQMRNWKGRIKTQVREMKNRQPRVGGNVGSMKGQTQQMK